MIGQLDKGCFLVRRGEVRVGIEARLIAYRGSFGARERGRGGFGGIELWWSEDLGRQLELLGGIGADL